MKTILMISSRLPMPVRKGDQRVILNRLLILSKKYKIIFLYFNFFGNNVPLGSKNILKNISFVQIKFSFIEAFFKLFINLFTFTPFSIALFNQSRMKVKIKELSKTYDIHFYHIFLLRLYANTVSFKPGKKVFYELIDSMALNYSELIKKSNFIFRLFYYFEHSRVKSFERNQLNPKFKYLLVSKKDSSYLGVKSKIFPLMLDLNHSKNYYKTSLLVKKIVFSGNLSYLPNVDAVHQFMPIFIKLRNQLPEMSFYILGSGWNRSLNKYILEKNVFFKKNVKNMIEEISKYDLYVAPISIASGAQNKVLEALASRIPLLVTKSAADPFNLINKFHCMIVNKVDLFYESILSIYPDYSLRKKLSVDGYNFVNKNYSLDKLTPDILDFFN